MMMTRRTAALAGALLLSLPAAADLQKGSPAPAFTLQARSGSPFSLSQLKGQVVLLNFWASWCGPCRQEMPLLEGLYKKYHPQGVTLVGISVDDEPQAANAALAKTPVSFPIVYDPESKVSTLYQVTSMPSTVIIDRNGTVRLLHRGYAPGDEKAYEESLRAVLKD